EYQLIREGHRRAQWEVCIAGDCGIPDNTAVSDGVHLLVPFAACASAACLQALRDVQLPHLRRLLARLGPPATAPGAAGSLSMPHERVLAEAHGLPAADGLIPFAAHQARQDGLATEGEGWAWIT